MNAETPPAGRLAPSPTGLLHLGNARTFLLAWLSARTQGLAVWLRWEDIDTARVKPGLIAQAEADLRWLGLDWDAPPVWQSQRLALYRTALAHLQATELVYPCTCSRRDIEQAASAPHLDSEGPTYPGTCSNRRADDIPVGRPVAWRFRVTHTPLFVDGILGPQTLDLQHLGGDFVVWKADDSPAYQLAVVVDDAAQHVVEVVRGDDLLSSTPRQLLLYAALGLPAPRFVHVPLVWGADGRRLAKRHGDTSLAGLRDLGVSAAAVRGWLAWSCGWLETPRPLTLGELQAAFDLGRLSHTPVQLTDSSLEWLLAAR